ncbi:UDP-N-acetylmuramoyl-tripeptide--D-alanyl-D-alanine ligase [Virgibacillus kekensis]|uniref:UDP-N-acetylmuramoyl-tripeptide--D-alanyl-D-alanine ligase n=1 Tax=Virgibacillus kekensis TaxID=202261 RepID=A0ABV9DF65_9BACI
MLFHTEWLKTIFNEYKGAVSPGIPIDEVSTDSRKETHKSLFVPIVGEKFNGHDYFKQAFDQGAIAALWQKDRKLPGFVPTDFPVFFVEDTLKALQQLASAYRDKINPVVIGITGSNGKTTTKDMMASVVGSGYRTHHTKGNLNNHIGLPLTILSMPADTEVLVVEMGMSQAGEIETLSKIAKPDYAVITNIGESHIEYLGSREGIADAKLEINSGLKENGLLVVDGDEPLLNKMHNLDYVITCGFEIDNDVVVNDVELTHNQTTFTLSDQTVYAIPLLGRHHALNAAFALTVADHIGGISKTGAADALMALQHTSMRFELLTGRNGVSVINDAYNASPTSMKAAINVVGQMDGFERKVLVLGDIFELGEASRDFHRSVADSVDASIHVLFTYGKDAKEISSVVSDRKQNIVCSHFGSKEELLQALESYLSKETLILFKASRGMQFEQLVENVINPA